MKFIWGFYWTLSIFPPKVEFCSKIVNYFTQEKHHLLVYLCFFKDGAITELVTVEANYIKRFLRIMEKLPGSFKSDSQIKKLLCNLRIDLIVPLHEKILKEFEEKAENTKSGKGPNIADVFIQIRVNISKLFHTSLLH